jgi:hypothetical protein
VAVTGRTAFAEIARHLYDADTFDEVLSRIAEVTVSTVVGCQLASVTLKQDGAFRTVASTRAAATEVDQTQYQVSEGPCSPTTPIKLSTKRIPHRPA